MKIGLLSDTHGTLDPRIFKYFSDVDEIWHAGDVGTLQVIDELEDFKPVIGVYGNIDNAEIRLHYPKFQLFERNGMKILMTHIAGRPNKYSSSLLHEMKKNGVPNLLVCGHSHILLVKNDPNYKMLWLNPGAIGNHGFHKVKTMLRFEINNAKIENMEVIELKR